MEHAQTVTFDLTQQERSLLAALAAKSIEDGLAGKSAPVAADIPEPEQAVLRKPCGAFVTLTRNGHLRGCIGNITARAPLYVTIAQMAYAAAFQDPRFSPLRSSEWPDTAMEISVLSELTRCPDPQQVEIGRHGLVLAYRGHSGVFLPQVPVEQGWDRLTYLNELCGKAGVPSGSWKAHDAELYWFEALVFSARS